MESNATPAVPAPGIVKLGVDDEVIGCVNTTKPLLRSATKNRAGAGGGKAMVGFL